MAGKRRTETHLYAESLEGRVLMAVNVFDIAGTWRRGLSDPGALAGTLSVDTDTGRVSAFNLLRTGGIKENTGTTISTPSGPKLIGGTPLPDTTYGLDSITFQGIRSGQYRIETALRGGYSMVASWQLPTGSLTAYGGGAVTFAFTSSTAYATSNPGSGTLKLANGAPYDISLSPSTIPENSPVGTRVGLLSTSDPTVGDAFTYALVSGNGATDNAAFQIVGNELRANATFDFESKSGYTVRVRTTDLGGLSYEEALPITVNNVNEAPIDIVLSKSSIAANSPAGTVVGLLSTIDVDLGDPTFTYSLVAGSGDADNASFEIVGNELRSKTTLDSKVKNVYSVRIRTTDRGGLSYEESFTINVTNTNGAPIDILPSSSRISENSPTGTIVGLLTTIDPDVGDTFTYALVSGAGDTDNASFRIVGNELRANASFNFEAKRDYTVRVRTTDQGGLWYEEALPITVLDVNEAPIDILLSKSSITENNPVGAVVGLLTTIDPDVGDTFVYTLVSGTGATDNASFQIVGNELRANARFDFEAKSSYTVRIRTTDRAGLTYDEPFAITVTDESEDGDVPGDFLSGVQDQLRRDAWTAYQGDRRIDRTEMITLLRKTGESDGVVTGPEVAGLRRITTGKVGTGWEIIMGEDVRSLARKVVEDNQANRMYQGSPLGSLNPAGGSTTGQMNLLVGKWFHGTDRPAANAGGSFGYQPAAGTLFVNGPSYTDTRQGSVGDCYFIAALGAIAKSNPVAIQDMFIDNADGTFTVRFFYSSAMTYVADYVTVDRMLPVSGTSFVYSNMGDRYTSVSNELWMPLAEKAYVQWNETGLTRRGNATNAYSAIEGGWMSNVNSQVLGRVSSDYSFSSNSNKQILVNAINTNKAVTLGTKQSIHGLYGGHAYMVVGYDAVTDTFRTHNPWGTSHPMPLTWSQLQAGCSLFTVADPSSVPAVATFVQTVIAPVPVAPVQFGGIAPDTVITDAAPASRMAIMVGPGSRTMNLLVPAPLGNVPESPSAKFHGYGRNFAKWQGSGSLLRPAGVSALQGPRMTVATEFKAVTVALAGTDPVIKS